MRGGLLYGSDREQGIRRRRRGQAFAYVRADGNRIADRATLERIARLAIPPAWTSVWIAADPRAHVQATGRDARGRKQYRYHALWQEQRSRHKFGRLAEVGRMLPLLRRRVHADLDRRGLVRRRVLALVVDLIDRSGARIGSPEYLRSNGSYGLTTLRNRHLDVRGSRLRLEFRGKSGVDQCLEVDDARLARLARRCQDLPGQTLFQYVDGGDRVHAVRSQEVNAYLRQATGGDLSAKELRTWHASASAVRFLCATGERDPATAWNATVAAVAKELGNTKAVCRKFYIHPAIQRGLEDGRLRALCGRARARRGLEREEGILLDLLRSAR